MIEDLLYFLPFVVFVNTGGIFTYIGYATHGAKQRVALIKHCHRFTL